jgi:hypothetical protein
MNEKMKRKTLNEAFKRFQRLPMLLPIGDTRASAKDKPAWQPMHFGLMGASNPKSALQALAE